MMTDQKQQIIEFIMKTIVREGLQISEDTPLVSSGLNDSFALVDILNKLEEVAKMRIPAGKVQPKDMDTVRRMFETAQRVGKPRT